MSTLQLWLFIASAGGLLGLAVFKVIEMRRGRLTFLSRWLRRRDPAVGKWCVRVLRASFTARHAFGRGLARQAARAVRLLTRGARRAVTTLSEHAQGWVRRRHNGRRSGATSFFLRVISTSPRRKRAR